MIKLKDLLSEKFASKAQQGYMFATDKEAAEKLASKMLKDEERRDNLRLKNIKGDFLNKF